jgi:hypothetical protein
MRKVFKIKKYQVVAVFVGIILSLTLTYTASAVERAPGDGIILYGDGAKVSTGILTTPDCCGSALGALASVSVGTIAPTWIYMKISPIKEEIIAGTWEGTNGKLELLRWNGSAWSLDWTEQKVGSTSSDGRAFTLGYEKSGEAVAAWAKMKGTTGGAAGTQDDAIEYKVWNGSSWTASTSLDLQFVTGSISWMHAWSHPASGSAQNDITMCYGTGRGLAGEATQGGMVGCIVWDGDNNTWGNEKLVESNAEDAENTSLGTNIVVGGAKNFGGFYEQGSGDFVAVSSVEGGASNLAVYTTWNDSNWTATASFTFLDAPVTIDCAAMPYIAGVTNNQAVCATLDDGAEDNDGIEYDGNDATPWNTTSAFDANGLVASSTGRIPNDTIWLVSGTNRVALINWGETTSVIQGNTWNEGGAAWETADGPTVPDSGLMNNVHFEDNPIQKHKTLFLVNDSVGDLHIYKASLSSGTTVSWGTVATNLTIDNTALGMPAEADFFNFASPSQTHFKWNYDDGAVGSATAVSAEDIAASNSERFVIGTNYRLRIQVSNEGPASSSNDRWELQYSKCSDVNCTAKDSRWAWFTIPTTATIASHAFQLSDSQYITNGSSISSAVLTASDPTFKDGFSLDSRPSTSYFTLSGNNYSEFMYSLTPSQYASAGANYLFRMARKSGIGSATYASTSYSRYASAGVKNQTYDMSAYRVYNTPSGAVANGGPVKVDDAADFGELVYVSRQVIRTSGGTLYAVVVDSSSVLQVYKSTNGTSWALQDSSNSPTNVSPGASIAIDSTDVIHIVYRTIGANSIIKYITFNAGTDLFVGVGVTAYTATTKVDTFDIAIDSSDKPHLVANSQSGTDYYITYTNRISGSWKAEVTVSATNLATFAGVSLTISDENIPEVSYYHPTVGNVIAAVGNTNDATSFTNATLVGDEIGVAGTSIAVDSSGNTWVAYVAATTNYVTLIKHPDGGSSETASWATWDEPINNSNVGTEPSITINGTNVYVLYQNSGADVAYDMYNGSTWSGETVLQTGTFQDVKAKWSYLNNTGSSTRIDYLYSDATDVYWASLGLGANPLSIGTPINSINTATTLTSHNQKFRIRALVHVGNVTLPAIQTTGSPSFSLQYAEKSGTCDALGTGESYSNITTTSLIAWDRTASSDGVSLVASPSSGGIAIDPYHDDGGHHATVSQTYEELNNFRNSVAAIPAGSDGMWDFALKDNNAPDGSIYCIRAVQSNNTVFVGYSNIPEIIIYTPGATTYNQTTYQWYENANDVQPGSALASENSSTSLVGKDDIVRLRMNIAVGESELAIGGQAFRLQVASSLAGPWTDVGAASAAFQFYNNPSPSGDSDITSKLLSDSTNAARGTYQESNPTPVNPRGASVGHKIEYDWALRPTGQASLGSTYYFRMVKDTYDPISYTNYPSARIGKGSDSGGVGVSEGATPPQAEVVRSGGISVPSVPGDDIENTPAPGDIESGGTGNQGGGGGGTSPIIIEIWWFISYAVGKAMAMIGRLF